MLCMSSDRKSELVLWQPILDLVVAGRTKDHTCPYCEEAVLEVEADYFEVKLQCPGCGMNFYGQLA